VRRLFILCLAIAPPAHAEPAACLAQTASRYAHETERNLSRVFALAEQRDIVLSFDEADALFGRRSETRDAHDRYANQEVSYLLARIERFQTVERLASNGRRTLIAGFGRRSRNAGLILIQTETGVRVLEFSRADRAHALAYAEETLRACPPRSSPLVGEDSPPKAGR
jgi:hypothetical protein